MSIQDYYTSHGDDALFVAETIFKTSSVVKYWGGADSKTGGIPMVSISKLNAIALMRDLLLRQQKRVEIWQNDGKTSKSFILGKWASPGNLNSLEDLVFGNSNQLLSSPIVLAVKPISKGDQKIIGLAYTDAATMHTIGVAEFIDNDTFSNFESILIQLSVKECIIPDDSATYEGRKIKAILDRCDIVTTICKKSNFETKDVEQDLNRLLAGESSVLTLPEFEKHLAMGATACLINYLQLLSDESNFGQYQLVTYDLSQFMRLDSAAIKALNLMPSGTEGTCFVDLGNLAPGCRLKQNNEFVRATQPNQDDARCEALSTMAEAATVKFVGNWQNLVQSFVQWPNFRQSIQVGYGLFVLNLTLLDYTQNECLKVFPDLHRIGKKFIRGKSNLQDVIRVYQVVITLPYLSDTLSSYEGEYRWLFDEMYTEKLREYNVGLSRFQEMVETTIDIGAAENHEYIIKADFDDNLQVTKAAKEKLEKQLVPEAERVADELGVEYEKKLKLEQHSQYGWHFRLTKTDAAKIRGKKEYQELATNKSGSLFTTPTLRRLSGSIDDLRTKYEELQESLVKEIIGITAGYFPVFERLNQLIAHLDVIASFAQVAVQAPEKFTRPKVLPKGGGDLIFTNARHPCLEAQEGVSFISNNVEMSREKSKFQIITGPNMGGKSTYIRQIGVIVLMSQIGSFVPCLDAKLPLLDAILCRVGASDSQLKGVSTFMAEMLETASILRAATPDSLIIIDELGRGTSTYDGFGLAWAISEYIGEKIGSFCLFATHFHELTAISETMKSVKNLHVKARTDDTSITLLYKVEEGQLFDTVRVLKWQTGICDQSFGIHVAELAAFPESVVRLAKRKADELEDFSTQPQKISKYSPEDVDAGNDVIRRFLQEYRELSQKSGLSSNDLNDTGLKEILAGLRQKYDSSVNENLYLREMVVNL
ncbi:MutS-like protein [Entophlyctis sp. JEL0112]|nr:MutS-like protein [Entophlyctis sp. JEL0112]